MIIGAAGMSSSTAVMGATLAHIGDHAVVAAAKVDVTAESQESAANSLTSAATGGIISVGVTDAHATNRSSVNAYVGDGAAVTTTTSAFLDGNIDIHAIGRAEADANALAAGGGGVQVGVANAVVDVEPEVSARLGAGVQLNAAGSERHRRLKHSSTGRAQRRQSRACQ